MPRSLFRLLLLLASLTFVAGACSSGDDDDDAAAGDDVELDDSADSDDGDDGDDAANALELIEQLGFRGEGGECIVDSLEDQGIDLDELDTASLAAPSSELADALAHAGADCVDVLDMSDLPAGATDLTDPQVYESFVDGFVSTSGLPEETARCIADYFIDNEIDPASVIDDEDVIAAAMAECA